MKNQSEQCEFFNRTSHTLLAETLKAALSAAIDEKWPIPTSDKLLEGTYSKKESNLLHDFAAFDNNHLVFNENPVLRTCCILESECLMELLNKIRALNGHRRSKMEENLDTKKQFEEEEENSIEIFVVTLKPQKKKPGLGFWVQTGQIKISKASNVFGPSKNFI